MKTLPNATLQPTFDPAMALLPKGRVGVECG